MGSTDTKMLSSVQVAGVERIAGVTRKTYAEVLDSSTAGPALPRVPPSRTSQVPWSRAYRAFRHADNMLDDVPEAADLLGFY